MQWVRLDTAIPRNHKVLLLLDRREGYRAFTVYVCSLAYAGEQETDGFIPRSALKHLHGGATDAKALVEAGLWLPDEGGWSINDWADRQVSTDEVRARTERARAAARKRWGMRDA